MNKVFYENCTISIIFLILNWTLLVENLHWDITSEYIVFGKDVLLNCDGTACSSTSTKMWIGGPLDDLICYNGVSSNPSKYEMMVKNNRSFGLMIKNLTIDDINRKYTCACGLLQYTKMLDLHNVKYIYPPQIYDHFNMQNTDDCHVDIVMAVYPLPRCFIVYESIVQAVIFTSVPTYSVFNKSSIYKLVRIQQSLQDMRNNDRGGNPSLKCTFETADNSVFYQNLTMCQKDNDDIKEPTKKGFHYYLHVFVAVIGGIVLLLFVPICFCIYVKHRN